MCSKKYKNSPCSFLSTGFVFLITCKRGGTVVFHFFDGFYYYVITVILAYLNGAGIAEFLSENFEYKEAKRAKGRNDSRIRYLEAMIKTAVIIEDHSEEGVVGLFDKVTVYVPEDDEEES